MNDLAPRYVYEKHSYTNAEVSIAHVAADNVLRFVAANEKREASLQPDIATEELDVTGLMTWAMTPMMSGFLVARSPAFRPRAVVELGAGGGLLGLSVKTSLPCDVPVLLTDYSARALSLLEHNIEVNGFAGSVTAEGLAWTKEGGTWLRDEYDGKESTFDLVIGSELLYHHTCTESLIATAVQLLDRDRGLIFLGFHSRLAGTTKELLDALDSLDVAAVFFDLDSVRECAKLSGAVGLDSAVLGGSVFLMAGYSQALERDEAKRMVEGLQVITREEILRIDSLTGTEGVEDGAELLMLMDSDEEIF